MDDVYSLTKQIGQITQKNLKPVEEPCPDTLMVSRSSKLKDGVIRAEGTAWNALPRKPVIADATQSVYVEAVRDFLESRRIADPKVRITRILRVDLDGDGEEEVLISATNYFTEDKIGRFSSTVPRGTNRIPAAWQLFRRHFATRSRRQSWTQLVAGELYPKPEEPVAPNVYQVAAVLDLNGDGKLEVIVHSFYYEGAQTTIYRCEPDTIEAVLFVECGV